MSKTSDKSKRELIREISGLKQILFAVVSSKCKGKFEVDRETAQKLISSAESLSIETSDGLKITARKKGGEDNELVAIR